MKRLLVPAVLALAVLAGAARAGASNECRGLQVCLPVQGPWVVVPTARTLPPPQVQYQLSCPKGYVAAGLDAEVTDQLVDLSFLGAIGAPVNPGISTSRDVVFLGQYVGTRPRTPAFRPHVGCMPAQGGGGRVPTGVTPLPVGKPTARHVTNVVLVPRRTRRVVARCAPGERLVGAWHSVGFASFLPPTSFAIRAVAATQAVVGGRVVVTARSGAAAGGQNVVIQAMAVCAGGR